MVAHDLVEDPGGGPPRLVGRRREGHAPPSAESMPRRESPETGGSSDDSVQVAQILPAPSASHMAVVTHSVCVPSIATWAVGQEERAVGGHPDELRCCRPHSGQYPLEARVWRQQRVRYVSRKGSQSFQGVTVSRLSLRPRLWGILWGCWGFLPCTTRSPSHHSTSQSSWPCRSCSWRTRWSRAPSSIGSFRCSRAGDSAMSSDDRRRHTAVPSLYPTSVSIRCTSDDIQRPMWPARTTPHSLS